MTPVAGEPSSTPLKTGILGLGTAGWFHWERLRLREEFHVISVWDHDPRRCDTARDRGVMVCDSLDALWATAPQAVVIAVPVERRAEFMESALRRGCHVLVESPLTGDATSARRLWSLADQSAGTLTPATPWRADEDFRGASAAVESGRLGRLQSVRYLSSEWSNWPHLLTEGARQSVLDLCGPSCLDQLATLLPERPIKITGMALPLVHGFTALLEYAAGITAQLDVRRGEFAPLRTGWRLSGERGGYRQQRYYTLAEDGELIDEPVRLAEPPTDAVLGTWLHTIRSAPSMTSRDHHLLAMDLLSGLQQAIRETT